MFYRKSKYQVNYVSAILLGSLTGLIGFGLFILIITSSNTGSDGDTQQVDAPPTEVSPKTEKFYAIQHGVFSSMDAANQFKSSYASLNLSILYEINGQFYNWSGLAVQKQDLSAVQPPAFYKEVNISSSCTSYESLLETMKALNEQNFLNKNELSTKFPNEWVSALERIAQLSSDESVWRLHLLHNDVSGSKCLHVNF